MGARGPGARPPRTTEQKRKRVYNARAALRRAELAARGVTDLRRFRRLCTFFREVGLEGPDDLVEAAKQAIPGATRVRWSRPCARFWPRLKASVTHTDGSDGRPDSRREGRDGEGARPLPFRRTAKPTSASRGRLPPWCWLVSRGHVSVAEGREGRCPLTNSEHFARWYSWRPWSGTQRHWKSSLPVGCVGPDNSGRGRGRADMRARMVARADGPAPPCARPSDRSVPRRGGEASFCDLVC
jgi:hypothetical protein